jgi:NAD(P)H-hydrate epimerase
VDTHAIQHLPIASIDLMERAAERCVERIAAAHPLTTAPRVCVVCGPGNNGGDGLAVARLLHQRGYSVHAVTVTEGRTLSPDASINMERLQRTAVPILGSLHGSAMVDLSGYEVLVDALFGTGLDRPLVGAYKQWVQAMNRAQATRISIDLPSGLFAEDNEGNDADAIVQADVVLTLQCPKLSLLLPENEAFVGRFEILDIGLSSEEVTAELPGQHLVEDYDARVLLPARGRFMHKGRSGHALLIAGGPGRMGAAILAGRAAARSGVGLLTLLVPVEDRAIVHCALPEAMCVATDADLNGFAAIGIGPGMGVDTGGATRLQHVLVNTRRPMVIDADALTLLGAGSALLKAVPPGSILTPHPVELEWLVGRCATGFERLVKARELARTHAVVVVLKGAFTAICAPDGSVRFNSTGNPGMAKGGSGDALTGVLTGLLAQGCSPLEAAVLGVYAHGLAGDLAAVRLGEQGMLVSDLIEALPLAWSRLSAPA